MKKICGTLLGCACVQALPVYAEADFYGKANVSYEYISEDDVTYTDLLSNASRVGVKGAKNLGDELKAIYQLEYEIYIDSADTFKQRNIFVGLQGVLGTVIAGHFDTPFKAAQNKVDLFNDLRGDIKRVISEHENRVSNIVMYTTPSTGPFSASAAHVASAEPDQDDGASIALSYKDDYWYVAAAFDRNVEQEYMHAVRVVAQLNLNALQLGALYEQQDPNDQPVTETSDGWLVSALYGISDDWAVRGQYGRSDIIYEAGETLSVGLSRQLAEKTALFGYYTQEQDDSEVLDNKYLGLGIEVVF